MDRYQFIKTATSKGMPEGQALAVAAFVQERVGSEELVTKNYLHAQISDLKAEILKWFIGTAMFQTVALIGALITLVKSLR